MTKIYDVAIVGSGPAALTAAVYLARENHSTLVIEKGVTGGLMATIDKVDNYPGLMGTSGMELADKFWQQAESFGVEMKMAEATGFSKNNNVVKITTDDGEVMAKTLVIATGNTYRQLEVPGGELVHYCATCDGPYYKDKRLVVIGGGNSALQEAIFLSEFASHIDLVARGQLTASQILQDELKKYSDKISLHSGLKVQEIAAENNQVKSVKFDKKTLPADGVFVFIGSLPCSAWLKNSGVELSGNGYIKTDQNLMTALPGVFAAGDIRDGSVKQIAVAVGEGALAAHSIREYLEKL
ncbi:MAG: FAD-dependent oxidoreductase [Candidatus Nomurabacteria bacterium]|jgi:thioredoxin reductase (NADPH)|nr:FAD-dependent oxidoreductase [Candidatus Nomurabacteria bacterium]